MSQPTGMLDAPVSADRSGLSRWAALSLAGAAALGSAAPSQAQAQQPRRGGNLVMAQPQQPPSMDAITTSQQPSRNISLHL